MNNLKHTLAGIAFGALALSAQAEDKVQIDGAEAGHWTMDFDAAVKLAAEKKLPMMLNFTGSDWCGWCKLMDKNVFAEEVWQKFAADKVVLVTLDFPKDKTIVPEKYVSRNNELKDQFGVRGFPTYVVLDSDGKTKLGQLGAGKDKTPATFIDEFKGSRPDEPGKHRGLHQSQPRQSRRLQGGDRGGQGRHARHSPIGSRPARNATRRTPRSSPSSRPASRRPPIS